MATMASMVLMLGYVTLWPIATETARLRFRSPELHDNLLSPLRSDEGVFTAFELQKTSQFRWNADDERIAGLCDRHFLGEPPQPELLRSRLNLSHRLLVDERLPTRVADLRGVFPQVDPEHLLAYLSPMQLSLAACWTACHLLTT